MNRLPDTPGTGFPTVVDFGREVCCDLEAAESREWLVTNGIGGYAFGTVAGHQTRCYHGLLIAALQPPLGRKLLLAKVDETARYAARQFELFTNRWADGTIAPHGYRNIERFHLEGTTPVWTFALDDALLEKYLHGGKVEVQEIKDALRRATIAGAVQPVICGSAFKNKGVQQLLDAVVDYLPSPLDVPPMKGIDYKTGEARTEKQVRVGLAPQLMLEAAILRGGGFAEVPRGSSVEALVYVSLKGGDPAGVERPIEFIEGTADSQADLALSRFTALARRFAAPTQPYRSLVHPLWKTRYGDYDHLARVKEWSATAAAAEDAGSP